MLWRVRIAYGATSVVRVWGVECIVRIRNLWTGGLTG